MPQALPFVHRTAASSTRIGFSFGEMSSRSERYVLTGNWCAHSMLQPSSERSKSHPSPLVAGFVERVSR